MGMDLHDTDVFQDSRYVMSSRIEYLRLSGVSLQNCEEWDEDFLEYLLNILDKSAKEAENNKDLSDKDLNGGDRVVNAVGKSEDEDEDDPQCNTLDKSVKEAENSKDLSDKDLNGGVHVVNSVGKSEDEDEDDPQYNTLDKSVKELENSKDLSGEDLDGSDHFVNSVGKSENENSDDDDPQYKFFLSHVKGNGISFTFEVKEENGLSKIIEYQKEEPIDGRHDLEIDRNMDNVVEKKRKRKRSRSEPKNIKNVKKSSLRSVSLKKGSTPSHKHTSKKQSVSRFQPKSNKDGSGKMGEEQRDKSPSAERFVIKREKDPLVEDDYQHFLTSAEIVSGRINLPLKSHKKIVYDEQVDLGDVLCHEVKSMSPRSSGKNNVEEDDSCQILDVSHQTDKLKEKVMADLRKPFDEEEYNTLWHHITKKNHNERHKELRHGREKSVTTKIKAKSYLEQHKDLRREIEAVPDDKLKRLNLLRGFFFWLQHVAWGAFKPWKDASCLAVMPGSH